MKHDVARYYVHHLHATAGTPALLARAIERALLELERGDVDRFAERMSRLRRSLVLATRHRAEAAALARAFVLAARAARAGDPEAAQATLRPVLDACTAALPRAATA